MRLLIVDDERQIRESMTRYIAGLKMGFSEIRTASSGVEALSICEQFTPDLLIVDILMPELDGIQTIARILEQHGGIQIIIISGCNDFQYVKTALRFPVQDYVLKPIHLPELNAALGRAIEKMKEAHAQEQALIRMGWFMEALPDMQERFLSAQLHGRYSDMAYVQNTAKALELEQLLEQPMVVTAITLAQGALIEGAPARDNALDFPSLRRVLPDYLSGDRLVWADDMLVAVLSPGAQTVELMARIDEALSKIEQREAIRAVAGIGIHAQNMWTLSSSFRSACSALQVASASGARVINAGDILLGGENRASIKSDEVWMLKGELLRGDVRGLREFAAQLVVALTPNGADDAQLWHAKLELMRVYIKLLQNIEVKPAGNALASIAQLESLSSAAQIADWVDTRLAQLASVTLEQRRTRAESIAHLMTRQIHERYSEPLSLQVFANETNLSTNYLSQVFSENVGTSFLQYLTDCRMNRALELLADPCIPISQIGAMVGYENANYFARLFRKRYGMSPSEYRERMSFET